jgi:hypothetical protein
VDERKGIFESQGAGSGECGKFSQRMACGGSGVETITGAGGANVALQENGRLRHVRLGEGLFGAGKHGIGYAPTQYFVGPFE